MMEFKMVIIIEDLRYVILVVSQIGKLVENLGKFHWEGYLL